MRVRCLRLALTPTLVAIALIGCAPHELVTATNVLVPLASSVKASRPDTREAQREWGSEFASPGAQLTYEETSRVPTEKGTGVTYKLRASGLPTDKTYSLWGKWLDRPPIELYTALRIDSSGHVIQNNGLELEFGLRYMLEGEPIEYTLISSDKSQKAFIEMTPFPIVAQGNGKCRVSAKLLSAQGDVFLIRGEGFKESHALNVVAKSNGENLSLPIKADHADFTIVVAPAVIGKSGGDASVMVSDNACSATVRFKWGDAKKISGQEFQGIPLPTESVLEEKILEVGRDMGWSLTHDNRDNGVFIWRFKVKPHSVEHPGKECEGLFTWYFKRVGNNVALDDPVVFVPGCSQESRHLAEEAKRLQKEFQRRMQDRMGPIVFVAPTKEMDSHYSELVTEIVARFIKEQRKPPTQVPPAK